MKANELRIGNIVNRQGYELTVNGCDIKWFQEDSWNGLEPIPITEEWLVRFGFEMDKNLIGRFELKNHNLVFLTNSLTLELKACWDCGGYDVDIKYVHQLQNLFFALTGEELNISQ